MRDVRLACFYNTSLAFETTGNHEGQAEFLDLAVAELEASKGSTALPVDDDPRVVALGSGGAALPPLQDLRVELARSNARAGKLSHAQRAYALAIDHATGTTTNGLGLAELMCEFGCVLLDAGNVDDAEGVANHVASISPDFTAALLLQGRVMLAKGEFAAAVAPLRAARDLAARVGDLGSLAEAAVNLSVAWDSTGCRKQAMVALRGCLLANPYALEPNINYSVLLCRDGRVADAQQHWQQFKSKQAVASVSKKDQATVAVLDKLCAKR